MEGHEDFAEQDREDGKKMETFEQRKRLATAGDLCWKAGIYGDRDAGAWVGSIDTRACNYGGLFYCAEVQGNLGGVVTKRYKSI